MLMRFFARLNIYYKTFLTRIQCDTTFFTLCCHNVDFCIAFLRQSANSYRHCSKMSDLSDSENCRRNLECGVRSAPISSKLSYIEDCVENKIQFTRKIPHGATTKEFLKSMTSMCNQEDKEKTGYENFDNTNVAANPLILFHCSGKECRLQEPCEFPESGNILSSISVYINEEVSKPATSTCNKKIRKIRDMKIFTILMSRQVC
jgi:hypothetical protein